LYNKLFNIKNKLQEIEQVAKKKEDIVVTKASGEKTGFKEEKLYNSLLKAGASDGEIDEIIERIKGELYDGISTKKIYKMAFSLLKQSERHLAARYHLKRAIMELGPSGYPFEMFIAEILKKQGYQVEVGKIVEGKCVKHEVDVIAMKDNHHFMVECKYHNQLGIYSDVKIPLYIQARFKDIEAAWVQLPGHGAKFHQGWVVTNTKFSTDAVQYGNCAGLKLLSWDYPEKDSLKAKIDALRLYPITCLTSLTKFEKQQLLERKIVLCREIPGNEMVLEEMHISKQRIKVILEESVQLCNQHIEIESE